MKTSVVDSTSRRLADATRRGDPPSFAIDNPEAHKLQSYPLLDWLRFVLASVVFLDHAGFPYLWPLDGGLAVAVFLALSGWLIGGILIRSEPSDLPRFFFNRSMRIWAPYFATMAALYAFGAVHNGIDINWLKYLFYDATFTHITWVRFPRAALEMPLQGTGNHFWSISVEEQFYLVAPAIMLFLRWGSHPLVWGVITVLLVLSQSIFSPIGAGVCAAAISARRPIGATPAERWVAAAAAAAMVIFLYHWRQEEVFKAALGVSVVLALIVPGRRTQSGVVVGAISYPLYLNHWIGLLAVATLRKHFGAPYPLALAVGSVVAVTVAAGAWWLVDRPVMMLRNGRYTPGRGKLSAVAAYTLVAAGLVGGYLLSIQGY